MTHDDAIARFASHVKNDGCAGRVLIIEPTTFSHQEVIPSLVYFYNALGFGADVLLTMDQSKIRNITPVLLSSSADINAFHSLTESNCRYLARLISRSTYSYIYTSTLFLNAIFLNHSQRFAVMLPVPGNNALPLFIMRSHIR